MALFDENVTIVPAPRRRPSRGTIAGIWALVVALVVLLVLTFLPTAYVIQQPGPVYDTLGTARTADGTDVPLISVEGAETYPTAGTLDLLTVQVEGNRERPPSWFELALAWFDRTRAVVPIDEVFPRGQTSEERSEESSAMMVDSQQEATAAALGELGYDVGAELTVHSLTDDSAARDLLEEGDVIVAVDGRDVADAAAVRAVVAEAAGAPVTLTVRRDGETRDVSVTPTEQEVDGETLWLLGVTLMQSYDFPIDVTIQLDNVGGPSAGMMFALGIIDLLTPGELNGGADVAGTGTIVGTGEVGPIGGIRQKLWGAQDAGAEIFLAPTANCGEVVGHVPDGLQVFAVETLDDALEVLETVRDEGDLAALPTCEPAR
ncbi:PDZ domain-containing protein [Microbacterium sp. zg.Y1090]|uniref:YlbL family protein n=1 Tax=Microbacterium TaxID=33882 RepID=UPI00214D10B8|nr:MULTISPECIES: S16 family serine protease [unclassified Microbacterium]MCR2812053.1 PDZ domain-containing protein [Microbacterium sp. zg.Y1084]MCR2818508.1 PDZ domain-containing protein [Microbacterium sp. zg.Y1090]MDL5486321.1 S16 family serine protease [Microbacterium sp. zg-Y1211]WIM29516.1 S16 family serine protease [Microbacterium sp. zg-Y1090]